MLSEVTCSSASCHAVLSWLVPMPPVQGSRQQMIAACETPNEEAQPDSIFPAHSGWYSALTRCSHVSSVSV